MSDDLSENVEMMCLECGLPYDHPDHVGDADLDDERAAHADFKARVSERVEQKLAHHRAVQALVEHKLSPDIVPKPRTESLDRLEIARIEALHHAKEVQHRAERIVQDSRDEPEFVVRDGGVMVPADRDEIHAFIGQVRMEIGQAPQVKDVPDGLEFRNAYGTAD